MSKNSRLKNFLDKKRKYFEAIYFLGLKKEIFFFLQNITTFLSSGLTITEALMSIQEEMKTKRMRNLIGKILIDIQNGSTIADSFEKYNFLDDYIISLIRMGEQSGKLSQNLTLIIEQHEEEKEFKSKLKSSLLYLFIVLVLTMVIGLGTALYTIPKIAVMYEQSDAELPLATRVLVQFGAFMTTYGPIALPAGISIVLIILYFLFIFNKTKHIGHSILFRIPVLHKLFKYMEISRFGFLLGNMLEAGLPIAKSLVALSNSTSLKEYKDFYLFLKNKIEAGIFLNQSIEEYKNYKKILTFDVKQMIMTSEKSGTLTPTLFKIGSLYKARAQEIAKNLPVILEPILLLVIAAGVLVFVMGTMMPIYNMVNVIK